MPKQKRVSEHWKPDPDPHDFPAASDYLSLVFPADVVTGLLDALQHVEKVDRKAKDLLRAGRLPLLPANDPHVAKDLKSVARGQRLSPVILVRGRGDESVPLIVADGYHRICASYHLDEDEDIPCRIVDLP